MNEFLIMLETILIFFIYIFIGFVCAKSKIINKPDKQTYIDLIINVTLPATILSSFDLEVTGEVLNSAVLVAIVSFLVYTFSFFISAFIYKGFPEHKQPILKYATLISNANFVGMPLVGSIFGAKGIFLSAFYLIPTRIFLWTAGISLFTSTDVRTKIKNIILNPSIIAILIGIIKLLTNSHFPHIIDTVIKGVGECTGVLAMFVVGVILAEIDIRTVFDKSLFFLSFVRLAAIPLILLLVMKCITLPDDTRNICVLLTAMPAAVTTAILAAKYGADDQYAAKTIFVTTVLSLITVPLLTLII